METLGNFGYHRCRISSIRITYKIIVWAPYGNFYFSNFDLPYFNKYRMDFNPVKCTTKYKALVTGNWNSSWWNVY